MLIAAGAAEVKPAATIAGNLLRFIVEIFRSSSHLRHVSISGAYVRLEGGEGESN